MSVKIMQKHQQKVKDRENFRLAAIAAYIAAVLVVLIIIADVLLFLIQGNTLAIASVAPVSGIIFQLLMFAIVAVMPAPSWARACGYGARFIIIVGSILWLNGLSILSILPLQLGGAAIGAIWLIVVSWRMKGAARVVGTSLALLNIVFSLHAMWSQGVFGLVAMLLNLVWLFLLARFLYHAGEPEPSAPKEDSSWLEWHYSK